MIFYKNGNKFKEEEYKNGIKSGSVIRDIQIVVIQCTNELPNLTGIDGTNVFIDTICAGQSLCFDIFSNDTDVGQNLTVTWNSGIPNATFATSAGPHPTGTFCWNTSISDASNTPYTFTVTVEDDNEDIDGRYSTVALIKTETNNWTLTGPLA